MNKKGIVLFSGGLDSMLTIRVLLEQGIEVEAVNFRNSFGTCSKGIDEISEAAKKLCVRLHKIDISAEFLEIVKSPKFGYGKNMNPCVDCKIFMCSKARELMKSMDAAFVATGEVLGQRPMSQHRPSLNLIERESGLKGYLLRPLCAKLMPETIAEREGVVDRNRLLDFNGRTRKPQMELAKNFGIDYYPTPAGGCLLTDPCFAKRLRDEMRYKDVSSDDVSFLKMGRHFRISDSTKLIVSRNESEGRELMRIKRDSDVCCEPIDIPGPLGLIQGEVGGETARVCAGIIARYCSKAKGGAVRVGVWNKERNDIAEIEFGPIDENLIKNMIL